MPRTIATRSPATFLRLPGVDGSYAHTPSSSALSITSDIDLRWYGAPTSWTGTSNNSVFIGKWTSGLSYVFYLINGGTNLYLTLHGTTTVTGTSSVSPGFSNGSSQWIRATWQQSTGYITFYTGGSGLTPTWVQLGSTIASGLTSVLNTNTDDVEVGSDGGGTAALLIGNVYRAQIYSGINGTLEFDANFAGQNPGVTSFTEGSSNAATVTISGSATIIGRSAAVGRPKVTAGEIPYQNIVLADMPLSYWRLSDTNTTAIDQENNYNGTYGGTYTQSVTGLIVNNTNTATTFNAGYVTAGPSNGYNGAALTWECWVNVVSLSGSNTVRVVGNTDGNNGGVNDAQFYITPAGVVGWDVYYSSTHYTITSASGVAQNGVTLHLIGTSNNTTSLSAFYINGVLIGTTPGGHYTAYAAPNFLISGTITGSSILTNGAYIDATIDEVAVYNYTLTQNQVLNHYNAGKGTILRPLVP